MNELISRFLTDSTFLDEEISQCARDLSKTGQLCRTPEWLTALDAALTSHGLVDAYIALRTRSGRCESEWRDEFVARFPRCAGLLPAVECDTSCCMAVPSSP